MVRTLGVEEEFLLVRASGPEPTATGTAVAEAARSRSDAAFEHELKREQAELGTEPCRSLPELAEQLRTRRAELSRSAVEHGSRLAALGTSPVAHRPEVTEDPRYQRIQEVFGQVAAPQLTCGMHVHVAVDSPEEGVQVIDRIGPWLPPLVALSANSPYWQGEDTGYASYRSILWGQWPTAGPTEPFGDLAGYERARAGLIATGAALDEGMLYFNARLSARYPTVEVRVADVCPTLEDAVTIASLVRALVETAATEAARGHPPAHVRAELVRAASWRAARQGTGQDLVDESGLSVRPAWEVVQALVERVAPALERAGDTAVVESSLARLRTRGTGADLQRATFGRTGSHAAVVDAVVEQTRR